jgi:molecular chaperone DnaK
MGTIAAIKLGTTYSALAALNAIGKPEIVADLSGNRVVPSIVAFNGGDSVLVGVGAKNKLSSAPTKVVQHVKRMMSDPSHRYDIDGSTYSPIEISAFILKKLKEECVQLGEIEDVVITVPAHFNEIERKSTMDAGKIAGLNVLGVVNKPTAAAVYYASQSPMNGNVVVYHLGGGTFDVSILTISGDKIDVLASKGDGHLGGVDFDNELKKHAVAKARQELGHELFSDIFSDQLPEENTGAERTYFTLMDRAEQVKKQLSGREGAKFRGAPPFGNVSVDVARIDFEEMISSHLASTEMLLENALDDADLTADNIDKVVLVGGSTRIPKVSQMLESFFGFAPEKSINPDEAVTLGAAIMAGKRKLKAG